MKFSVISEKSGRFFSAAFPLFVSLSGLAALLFFPEVSAASAKKAVFVCLETLIPSLFPFFVFSNLAISFGFTKVCGRLFSGAVSFLFGTSGKTAAPFALGLLSGFPVGAASAVKLYLGGEISKDDCEKALTFSNSPSAGFIVTAVGVGVFGSVSVGWRLYFAILASTLAAAALTCRLFKGEPCCCGENTEKIFEKRFVPEFLSAVVSAGKSVLSVSAFVVFFSVICGVLAAVLPLGYPFSSAICGFFEISAGASSLLPLLTTENLAFAAALLSWSGLSVHFQVLSQVVFAEISPVPYLFSKLFSSLFAAGTIFLFSLF